MSDPYRTKAEIPPEPMLQEKILQDIIRDEKQMKQLKAFKLWRDAKLGFGLLTLLAICFLVAFLFVSGMLDPAFSFAISLFLGFFGVASLLLASILLTTAISLSVYDSLREWWLSKPHRFKFKIPFVESIRGFFEDVEYGKSTARIIKNLKKEIDERKAWLENG